MTQKKLSWSECVEDNSTICRAICYEWAEWPLTNFRVFIDHFAEKYNINVNVSWDGYGYAIFINMTDKEEFLFELIYSK